MNYCVIDIETIPADDLIEELRPEAKLGNLKDEKKIEAKKEEWEKSGQIKAMSVSPLMNKIVSIQIWSSEGECFMKTPGSLGEIELIKAAWIAIEAHQLIIGYNHIGFDMPTLINRSMFLGIPIPTFPSLKKYSTFPFYDVMQILAGWDSSKWVSLDWMAQRFGMKKNKGNASDVYPNYLAGKWKEIDDYCKEDVRQTHEIYKRMIGYYK